MTATRFADSRILVFVKAPQPGRVKTRLIRRYGARGAARIQKTLVNDTLQWLTAAGLGPVELWCAPDSRHGFFHACRRRYGVVLRRQRGADLGQRMHHALSTSLRKDSYAVLIGADCPSLDADALRLALRSLQHGEDFVLGPARDGGYVLIGASRACQGVFRDVKWGSASVLQATRRRLQRSGLSWSELAPGWDVDYPDDVRRWRRGREA